MNSLPSLPSLPSPPLRPSPLPPVLRWSGPALAAAYGLGVRLHRACSSPQDSPLATLCVGNISAGGTGKTPASAYFARQLAQRGRRPAVLMRGYKDQARDEAAELQNALADLKLPSPVIVNSDRLAGARLAREKGCDTAILDDGFQHWRLKRDLDIVLVDATDPFSGMQLLPYGRLREHPRALARAGVVVLTRSDCIPAADLEKLRAEIARFAPQAVVAAAMHRPGALRTLSKLAAPATLAGTKVAAVCGIGNPEAFRQTLIQQGAALLDFTAFPDHHGYTQRDLDGVLTRARSFGAAVVVVTEKDSAKLSALTLPADLPVVALAIRFELTSGEAAVWKNINDALAAADRRVGVLKPAT